MGGTRKPQDAAIEYFTKRPNIHDSFINRMMYQYATWAMRCQPPQVASRVAGIDRPERAALDGGIKMLDQQLNALGQKDPELVF